jgi:outer membrane protein assembly factor BamB
MNADNTTSRRMPLVILVVLVGFLAAGCSVIASPQGWAGPVVHDDVAYVSSDAGKLGAYRVSGSPRLWEFPANGDDLKLQAIYGTPQLGDDTIYLTGYDGNVAAVSKADGSQRWHQKIGDRVIGGPLVLGDLVFAGNDGGNLVALDRSSGVERWRERVGNQIWASPVSDDRRIFVATMDGRVTALNPDGSEVWQSKVANAAIAGTPALQDGVLYLGSFDKRLYAVDAETGETRWQSESAGNWFWTEPLIAGDTVMAGSLDGFVYAVDRQTGVQRWRTEVGAPVRAKLAVDQGVLVIPTGDGRLWGLRPNTGEQVWQPAEVGGKLFADLRSVPSGLYLAAEVGRSSHRLYRVDAAAGSVTEIPLVK